MCSDNRQQMWFGRWGIAAQRPLAAPKCANEPNECACRRRQARDRADPVLSQYTRAAMADAALRRQEWFAPEFAPVNRTAGQRMVLGEGGDDTFAPDLTATTATSSAELASRRSNGRSIHRPDAYRYPGSAAGGRGGHGDGQPTVRRPIVNRPLSPCEWVLRRVASASVSPTMHRAASSTS